MTPKKGNQFSTFGGVFTPSVLTILGVILFLRAGFVIGQAGILHAILILVLAEVISLLTAVSMSAIATNTPVKGGGAYFLISRALGPQFGGAIGLALFFAQALSVPFYVLGFSNSVVMMFPDAGPWFEWIALGTALVLFVVNWLSSQAAIRLQYVVMALLGLSIAVFLGGALLRFDPAVFRANLSPGYSESMSFWRVFAIYFPAVTGILAGVNMSGDLKDPAKSLVRGTMAAIGVGFGVYLLQIILCGGSLSRLDLVERPFEMAVQHALFGAGFLVMGGVFSATISSAVGSFMGSPRVLQALARDRIFHSLNLFARGSGDRDEPRLGLILTLILTVIVIVVACRQESMTAFDKIASIVTMFFLCTYGMINLAAFVESFGANPSFRPRFRFAHWTLAVLGALCCVGIMFLIDIVAALVAVLVISAIYGLLSRRVMTSAFGDARRGFQYALAVRSLRALCEMKPHAKNWRPTFLVMAGSTQAHMTLIQYAVWMEGARGLVTAAQVISGDLKTFATRVENLRSAMDIYLKRNSLAVFPEVIFCENIDEGIRVLAQSHSIGPLKPNTVLFGWPKKAARAEAILRHVWDMAGLGKSVVIVADKGLPVLCQRQKRIDIWWRGQKNGSLMATLSYLLTQSWAWRDAQIRIMRLVRDTAGRESSRQAIRSLVENARIRAEARVVLSTEPFETVLISHSSKADVVFMGMQPLEEGQDPEKYYMKTSQMLEHMPTTIMVHSSGEADVFE